MKPESRRALAGYYVDVFDMAKPSGQPGVTGKRHRPAKRRRTDRTFDNWLNGYRAYAAMLSAAFPLRAWQFWEHMGNVLEARSIAGDLAGPLSREPKIQREAMPESVKYHNKDWQKSGIGGCVWALREPPCA
uniref:Uncharacterized protein n=1 Tax=Sphaerodactylus townsendi TaxID=933632 RepID=A0ACB8F917_9SAUR